MLEAKRFRIAEIYVPTDKRRTLEAARVEALADDMLEHGQTTPIQVRQGKERYVLIEGLHRLEACRALGEETILCLLVQPRRR